MTILQIQALLIYLGYSPGNPDGVLGPRTKGAITAFSGGSNLEGEALSAALLEAVAKGTSPGTFWEKTPNFQRREFRCNCARCGGYPAEPQEALVRNLQRIRDRFQAPVGISSGVRCEGHNQEVGGVSNSRHLSGKAADFCVTGVGSRRVLDFCQSLIAAGRARYAYAIDENFVHLDIE